ncbi:MAG: hypothetical protein ABSC88_10400 [Terracidiphilus sp.]|jgi:hypothetical protein
MQTDRNADLQADESPHSPPKSTKVGLQADGNRTNAALQDSGMCKKSAKTVRFCVFFGSFLVGNRLILRPILDA